MAAKKSGKKSGKKPEAEPPQPDEDLVATLAQKDAEFKRDQGKAGKDRGWHVTDEELRDGLRYVDMDKHAIPLKKN